MSVGLNVLPDDGEISAEVVTDRRLLVAAVAVSDSIHGVLELCHIHQKLKRLGTGKIMNSKRVP